MALASRMLEQSLVLLALAGRACAISAKSAGVFEEPPSALAEPLAAQSTEHGEDGGQRPLLYVHLHKAGGSTACATFRHCNAYRIPNFAAKANCNCWNDHEAKVKKDVVKWMEKNDADACFVEHTQYWPMARDMHKAKGAAPVQRVSTLREPWARFWSTYERDYEKCKLSVQKWYAEGCRRDYGQQWGANFYVRALSVGKSKKYWTHGRNATEADFHAAKATLSSFDDVLILESADFSQRMWDIAGCTGPAKDIHSTNINNKLPSKPLKQAHNATFRVIWDRENALDIALYEWAVAKYANKATSSVSTTVSKLDLTSARFELARARAADETAAEPLPTSLPGAECPPPSTMSISAMQLGSLSFGALEHKQEITHVHIPKTAGTSVARLLETSGFFPKGHALRSHERVPEDQTGRASGSFMVTGLREPRSHVISQFMHCKYHDTKADRHIRPTRRRLGFPTLDKPGKSEDVHGLDRWLDHALENREKMEAEAASNPKPWAINALLHQDPLQYVCYSPWNPQSRFLLQGQGPVADGHQVEPALADVVATLTAYDHIGTSELYNASACLLFSQMNSGTVPSGCGQKDDREKGGHKHMALPKMQYHGVPQLDEKSVPCATLAKIDELTKIDRAVYAWVSDALREQLRNTGIREDASPE